jgi:hypothetical protein
MNQVITENEYEEKDKEIAFHYLFLMVNISIHNTIKIHTTINKAI